MTSADFFRWATAILWGLAVGGFYFYGLWWTLQKIQGKERPGRWLAASYAVRLVVALAAFWLAIRGGLDCLFLTLGGFFLMRILLTRRLGANAAFRHLNRG
jgi:F1F0 ATPase subunit 2